VAFGLPLVGPFDRLRGSLGKFGSKVINIFSVCGFALAERKTAHGKERVYHSAEGQNSFQYLTA
jgi:hypothetical protein